MIGRRVTVLTTIALLAALTAGCAPQPAPLPSPTTASPTAAPTPTPTDTPTPTPTAAPAQIPSSCDDVGTDASRAATVDGMTLQGDGVGFVRPAPPDAGLALGCDWIVGDATGILLLISTTDPAEAAEYVQGLPASDGYECSPGTNDSTVCELITPASDTFPAQTVETVVSREDVWIYMSASNIDGTPLLTDLIAQIWP